VIEWLSAWAEQIIVAVIIATIIEMMLPNGNNKKYVKTIIGVYILFTIISPILGKFTSIDFNNIDYDKYFEELETTEAISMDLERSNNKSIEEIYVSNLKQDMKSKLEEQGYKVAGISVDVEVSDTSNYGKIKSISLTLYKEEQTKQSSSDIVVNKIEEVKIGESKLNAENEDKMKTSEKNEVKEYLASVYEVNKKNIKINEN